MDEGRRFVTTSDDKTIRVWEFGIPVVIKYIADPTMHSVPAVAVSPNNNWLVGQSLDNQVVTYSTKDKFRQNRKKIFKGHNVAGYACQVGGPGFSLASSPACFEPCHPFHPTASISRLCPADSPAATIPDKISCTPLCPTANAEWWTPIPPSQTVADLSPPCHRSTSPPIPSMSSAATVRASAASGTGSQRGCTAQSRWAEIERAGASPAREGGGGIAFPARNWLPQEQRPLPCCFRLVLRAVGRVLPVSRGGREGNVVDREALLVSCLCWDVMCHHHLPSPQAHEGVCIGAVWHPLETSKVATCGWDGLIKYWD